MNVVALRPVETQSTPDCTPQQAAELIAAQFRAYNE